jgi:glycosyltransferase involved in cell wall biosynthesis
MYGTERVALDTCSGLADEFAPILLGPPGPAMDEAERLGFEARRFRGAKQFAKQLAPCLAKYPSMGFVATGVMHSGVCLGLNVFYRRNIRHFHIVHGGSDDRGSYANKHWLNHSSVRFIAVSEWTKNKLVQYGTLAEKVEVVANSLPADRVASCPKRGVYEGDGVRKVIVVSRLDPFKRVELLLDALDLEREALGGLSFRIFGLGPEMKPMAERAARKHPNVQFMGYSGEIPREMAASDLLLHCCPEEPFGLVVLEAMAANVVTMVADAGGAGAIVEDGVSGVKFRANDGLDLAGRLCELTGATGKRLNALVAGGRRTVEEKYSARRMLDRYRELLRE